MIRVKVTADARKERFVEKSEGVFEISVREPAEGNQANVHVRELVAKHFGVPLAAVRIETGHHSPQKRIHITFIGSGA